MKARLKKPVEGLEVDTIYELYLDDRVFRFNDPSVPATRYVTIADLFEYFEVLQPVSDTTKQAIREHINDLTLKARGDNYAVGNATYYQDLVGAVNECVSAVASVLEGEQ